MSADGGAPAKSADDDLFAAEDHADGDDLFGDADEATKEPVKTSTEEAPKEAPKPDKAEAPKEAPKPDKAEAPKEASKPDTDDDDLFGETEKPDDDDLFGDDAEEAAEGAGKPVASPSDATTVTDEAPLADVDLGGPDEVPPSAPAPATEEAPMEEVDLFGEDEKPPESPFDDIDLGDDKPDDDDVKPVDDEIDEMAFTEALVAAAEKAAAEDAEKAAATDETNKDVGAVLGEAAIDNDAAEKLVKSMTAPDSGDGLTIATTSIDTMADMVADIKREEQETDARMKKMGFEEVDPDAPEPAPTPLADVSLEDTPTAAAEAPPPVWTPEDDEKEPPLPDGVRPEFVQIITEQLSARPNWRKNRERVFQSIKTNVGCSDQEIQVAMQRLQAAYSFDEEPAEGDRIIRITETEQRGSTIAGFSIGSLVGYLVYVIKPTPPVHEVETVYRRYSDFVWLRETLQRQFPALFIPPLPPKKIVKDDEFIKERRDDLERFLNRVARDPKMKDTKAYLSFLSSPETQFKQVKKQITQETTATTSGQLENLREEFPATEDEPLENVLPDIHLMGDFLTRLKASSNVVSNYSTNLSHLHTELTREMSFFAGLATELNSCFSTCPFAEGCGQDLFPAFDDISENLNRESDLVKHLFHYQNKYDVQDLQGMLDGFAIWQKSLQQSNKIQAQANKKYRDPKKEGQELDAAQTIARDTLFDQEKTALEYQQFLAKLLLRSEVPKMWKLRTRTFKATSRQFSKQQSDNYTKTEAGFRERLPPG